MQIVQNAAREECACKGREEIRSQNACNARDTAMGLPSLVDWTGLLEAQEGEVTTHSQNSHHQQVCSFTFSKREKSERAWPWLCNSSTRFEIPTHSTLQRVPSNWLSPGQRGQPTASPPAFPLCAFTECLRKGVLSQSQSSGRVQTSTFWRQYGVGSAELVMWLQPPHKAMHLDWGQVTDRKGSYLQKLRTKEALHIHIIR